MLNTPVKRQILNQAELVTRPSYNFRRSIAPDCCRSNYCSWKRCRRLLFGTFPFFEVFQEYNCKRDLYRDVLSGLTIAFIQVPQSLAYAYLANAPPVFGLYTAFVSTILYFIFGSSRQANTGTFAIVCLLTGDIIISFNKHLEFDMDNAQTIAAICLMTGIYQFLFYILRLGKLCQCLSDTLINAFSVACACHITSSQIADVLGFKLDQKSGHFRIIHIFIDIGKNIKKTNYVTVLLSLSTLTILFTNTFALKPYLSKKCPLQIPLELIMLLLGILCQYLLELKKNYGVILIEDFPMGFMEPIITTIDHMKLVALQSIAIAVVSFIISASVCLYFSKKGDYEYKPNQDALAMSIINVAGSFFCCVPTSVSLVRTMLCFNMKAASQLVGIVSCVIIAVVIFWGGYIFCLLPRCIIASIIINCVIGTFRDFKLLKFYWDISKTDLFIWIITFIYVAFIDIVIGFGVGIGISILTICYQSFRTDASLLGNIPNTELYLDLRKYKEAQAIPEIKIFRYSGGINFATRQLFRKGLAKATGVSAKYVVIERTRAQRKLKPGQTLPELDNDFKIIVLDFSGITNIDYQGIEHFKSVVDVYKKIGIIMLMASPHGNIYETFLHIKNICHYDDQYPFFPTIHDAVMYAKSLLDNKGTSIS